jgi:tRNA 5-methylaminomethyl-2-thiouridine biosynthesis bifunctional protein
MRRDHQPWASLPARHVRSGDFVVPPGTGTASESVSKRSSAAQQEHRALSGTHLEKRWQEHSARVFTIAATGFGSGLDFLLTWQRWRSREHPAAGAQRLHYIAIDRLPVAGSDLAASLAAWPHLAELGATLRRHYPQPLPGVHRAIFDADAVTLDLWWGTVDEVLADLSQGNKALVDDWHLCASDHDSSEHSGLEGLWPEIAALSRPGATFAMPAPAGSPRAGSVATELSKRNSQHSTTAGKATRSAQSRTGHRKATAGAPRWDLPWHSRTPPGQVLVLGAGLAGCHTAAALVRRGLEVTVLERGKPAQAASGNAQGVMYTRLSHRHSALTDFALCSFDFAVRQYAAAFASGALQEGEDGALCGSFHQVTNIAELERMRPLLHAVPELAQVADAERASQLIGIHQTSAGYWYPRSGWLSPPAVCRALLQQPGIVLREHCGALRLQHNGHHWQALNAAGELVAAAPAVVVAAGTACSTLDGLDWLPLRAIRGQTTQLPALPELAPLRAALCHRGYIAPARGGEHCIGATFGPGDTDPDLRATDQAYNLAQLRAALPTLAKPLAALEDSALPGRTQWRCASPDYLPLVGPAPDRAMFLQRFAALRDNARRAIEAEGAYIEGLYLNTGHGSRGLTSTPLAAELLASQLCGESLPVEPEILRALAPARFLLRDLGRNRI